MNTTQEVNPPTISRRSVLKFAGVGAAALATAPLLSSCSSGSKDLTTVTVSLDWIKNAEYAGIWVADSKGYYKEEGLTVKVLAGGPNDPAGSNPVVAAGKADIGISSGTPDLISQVGKGQADFVMLGATYQQAPSGLMSLAAHPVRSAADLPGLKILGQQGTKVFLDALYKVNDLPTSDYTFVPTGYDPTGLIKKQGDAYECYVSSQPIILEEKYKMTANKDYFAVTWADLNFPSYQDTIYCTNKTLKDKRDVLESFMRATIRGWQDNNADPKSGAKITFDAYGKANGFDDFECLRENQLQIPLMESALTKSKGLFRIDKSLLGGKMYSAMKAAGFTKLPDVDKLVDQTILDAVYQGKATI